MVGGFVIGSTNIECDCQHVNWIRSKCHAVRSKCLFEQGNNLLEQNPKYVQDLIQMQEILATAQGKVAKKKKKGAEVKKFKQGLRFLRYSSKACSSHVR
jgi:hypothetical protein